jgi:hypothetical protein
MCGCKDCKGITLLKGTDGRGIVSITDNGDGTLTILYTDGTTYITPDFTGPEGPAGADGADGTNGTDGTDGTNAFKYIKEVSSTFDGESFTVTQLELAAAGVIPTGYIQGGLPAEYCDLHIAVYFKNSSGVKWIQMTPSYDVSVAGAYTEINASTGLITITLQLPPLEVATRVRIVILA